MALGPQQNPLKATDTSFAETIVALALFRTAQNLSTMARHQHEDKPQKTDWFQIASYAVILQSLL